MSCIRQQRQRIGRRDEDAAPDDEIAITVAIGSRTEIRRMVGQIGYRRDVMYGVTGAEKEYDVELSGTPGEYEVMLDRRRNWITGTWKLLVPSIPGEDVKLNVSLRDLLGGGA